MKLYNQILRTVRHYSMLKSGDNVLVAVSGGPDSVFLMHIMNSFLKSKFSLKIYIAHVNHNVRGKASFKDAEFVRKQAEKLGLPFESKTLKKGAYRKGVSLEEYLRVERYGAFKEFSKKLNVKIIATAHTLDDQAETVLMRILKGASLKGLAGVHPVRRETHFTFIRPLIEVEKKSVLAELMKNKIPYRIDESNNENKFLRNKIRNQTLPYLSKINPRVKRSLFNMAESLREDFEFLKSETRMAKNRNLKKAAGTVILSKKILEEPGALQKEVIREALIGIDANIKKITFHHWKDIDYFMRSSESGKALELPGRVLFVKQRNSFVLKRRAGLKRSSPA